jgi:RHS repeat-associated protein
MQTAFTYDCSPNLPIRASRYTGKERDSESGFDNFEARYYGSSMGRFMSPDPSGLYYANPMNPQSLNLYSYVLNNPLIFTDPHGLDCVYTNNQSSSSVSVTTVRGDCINAGGKDDDGVYVDGHIDTDSYKYTQSNGNYSLNYNFTPDGSDSQSGTTTLGVGKIGLDAPPDPDQARISGLVQGIADRTAGFPDVCSGGGFVYAGVQAPVGKAHGFAGYLGNYDSKGGFTNGGLVEGSGHSAGAAGAYSPKGGPEALVFVPFAEAGGGLVGVSKEGLAVGGYVGTPEKFPVGVGAGAYFNISTMGACNHR